MPSLLGIYHGRQHLDEGELSPMLSAFGQYSKRHIHRWQGKGFLLLSANELASESNIDTASAEGAVVAALGTMVLPGQALEAVPACLARAWQERGVDGLAELEGAFTGVVYAPQGHRLWLLNDKFGMRPLFYATAGDYLAFSNEFEPLLHLPGLDRGLCLPAVADYFCLGTTLGDETLVKGIRNLPPASVMAVSPEDRALHRYWRCDIQVDAGATIEAHAARLSAILREVVQQLFDQLTNVRCLLSAGADSRLILSCMRPDQRARTPFLTSKLSFLATHEDRDLIGALKLAARLGLKHEVLEIAFAERDFGPGYFDEVRQVRDAKIVGGWHGGEYLGGFCAKGAPVRNPPVRAELDGLLSQVFSRRFRRQLAGHPHDHCEEVLRSMAAGDKAFAFQVQQFARGFFTNIYMGSRGTWLQPFENINQGYSPFWDSRFLQALLAVPFAMVADYQLYNVIFRDCLPELADIPSNSPLTLRPDTALARMEEGTEPKAVLKPKYQHALEAYRKDRATWRRRIYRWWRMRRTLRDGDHATTMRFIDFEAWLRRYLRG